MLYKEILKWFEHNRIGFASKFEPYYISSVGAHLINLENYRREFYWEHGRVADLRNHVFMAAPPGFSKTFFLESNLIGSRSVFGSSEYVPTALQGSLSEAGFVGTIRLIDGEPTIQYGAAYEYQNHVLGIDEFSCLTNIMKMEHSLNLDTAILTALDNGKIEKRLAAGPISYHTHLTLWSGSQPSRFDLSSGLGRRFIFLFFIPSKKEQEEIRTFRRAGINKKPDNNMSNKINKYLKGIAENLKNVKRIEYSENLYKLYDRIKIPHYEEKLFDRLAIGYNITNYPIEDTLYVRVDNELKRLIEQEVVWRKSIKIGPEEELLYSVIKETPNQSISYYRDVMLVFGIDYRKTVKLLEILLRSGRVGVYNEKTTKRGRPKKCYYVRDD